MKRINIKIISIIALILYSGVSFADTFEVDGIYYETDASNNGIAIVTSNPSKYSGTITIPESVTYNGATLKVTTIGSFAFSSSKNLTEVNLPESLTNIESYAFYSCPALTAISLPSSLNKIGESAFSSSGLKSIIIPRSVTEIGESIFSGCKNLESISVEQGNEVYDSRENCNAIIKGNILLSGCNKTSIPTGIAVIARSAFSSLDFTSIELPNTITTIGSFAFSSCRNLTKVVLSESLTKIESYAFYSCSELKEISLPLSLIKIEENAFSSTGLKSIIIRKNVSEIGESVFSGCKNLETIVVEQGNETYDSRDNCNAIIKGDVLLAGCNKTQIPSGITTIARSAFSGLYFTSLELPNTITTIGSFAFSSCSKLTEVVLPASLTQIDSYAFYSCSKLSKIESHISIPFDLEENVFSVYEKAILYVPSGTVTKYKGVKGWQKFTNIQELSTPVVGIFEVSGFYYYPIEGTNYVEVVAGEKKYSGTIDIPATVSYSGKTYQVTSVAEKAFQTCPNLNSVKMAGTIMSIGNYAFQGCDNLHSLELSESLVNIGDGAFEGTGISSIVIPKTVTTIGKGIIVGCDNLSSLIVESGNTVYNSKDNCNAIINNKTLISGCKSSTIPNDIEIIEEDAFANCTGLLSLNMPNAILEIKARAFQGCEGLSSLHLSESLVSIGNNAFEGSRISSLFIPLSVKTIGELAFANCKELTTIQVEDGNAVYDSRYGSNIIVLSNTNALILGCSKSQIPDGIVSIGDNAFRNIDGLTEITLPKSIKSIGENAFNSCKLSRVISYITTPFDISETVFYNIGDNSTLQVPLGTLDAYKEKKGWIFNNIVEPSDENISFKEFHYEGVNYLVDEQNKSQVIVQVVNDRSLRQITILDRVEHEGHSFSVTAIGGDAFSSSGAEMVVLPNTIKKIGDNAFNGSPLLSITIPNSVEQIGSAVFSNCKKLGAVEWSSINVSDSEYDNIIKDLKKLDNPNLLLYIPSKNYMPNDIIKNVVVNGRADKIVLSDVDNGYSNFYCPKAFTADKITYTHKYCLPTKKEKCQGWETIVLPFDVQTIKTSKGETIKPVMVAENGEKRFWLRELTYNGFADVSSIKANTPFIISMPNWDGYQDFYNITGDVSFSAQDVTVEATDIHPVTIGEYNFYPSFQVLEKNDYYYAINKDEYDGNDPGSIFVPDLRDIRPFEAYFTKSSAASARKAISIADLMEGITAIADIPVRGERAYSDNGVVYIESAGAGTCNIYSMSGQLMRKVILKKGTNTVSGLSKGIYLVNGNKVLVK